MPAIVLDTNCLLAILPSRSPYHNVWEKLLSGEVVLCVSTDILDEYEEILGNKIPPHIAASTIQAILNMPGLIQVQPTFFWHLIQSDPDDNKFVDCAICGGAELIVTNDTHFNVLKDIDFPKVAIQKLEDFSRSLG